ncbi:hypothetical protein EJ06DRAFT_4986 [Trichodelitschia bisporula]|uniref:Uncharacterized protein n=1 Tax=Trichodelitschia bisporula TaxID=703511 RepID=A0A6G1I9Q6_9PEZI|nr:hypothetical protein EJ06DRAFT_4986 [Trichodelitschia bisporula]
MNVGNATGRDGVWVREEGLGGQGMGVGARATRKRVRSWGGDASFKCSIRTGPPMIPVCGLERPEALDMLSTLIIRLTGFVGDFQPCSWYFAFIQPHQSDLSLRTCLLGPDASWDAFRGCQLSNFTECTSASPRLGSPTLRLTTGSEAFVHRTAHCSREFSMTPFASNGLPMMQTSRYELASPHCWPLLNHIARLGRHSGICPRPTEIKERWLIRFSNSYRS